MLKVYNKEGFTDTYSNWMAYPGMIAQRKPELASWTDEDLITELKARGYMFQKKARGYMFQNANEVVISDDTADL